MYRNGHSPPAAHTAAIKRGPFILSGFDRQKQCDLDFNTIPFGAMWFRRFYTNENHHHITSRCTCEADAQRVRYGNNIAALFKACLQLSYGYGCADFWQAIAKGFGASVNSVRHMVDVFLAARRLYKQDHPAEDRKDRSGANAAVDRWDDFLRYWKPNAQDGQSNAVHISHEAAEYFDSLRGRLVDMAGVLPKEVDHQHYSSSYSRKRSPSPGSWAPRSPKRRQSSSYFDHTDSMHSRGPQPLTPVSSGIQFKGSATKHESQDVGPSEEEAQKTPCVEKNYASELFEAIRAPGKTYEAESSSSTDTLPMDKHDSMPYNTSPGKYAAEEKPETRRLREWIEALVDKKVLNAATTGSALKNMQAQIASLAQEARLVKEENAGLKRQLSKTDFDESTRQVVHRPASLEDKLLANATSEIQKKVAALDSKITVLEASKSQGNNASAVQDLTDRVASLEGKATAATATTAASSTAQATQASDHQLWTYAQRLENRITKVEAKRDVDIAQLEKTVEALAPPRSPSNSHSAAESQMGVEEMMKKLKNFPTQGSITAKIFQVEQNVEAQLEHYKTDTNAKFDLIQQNMNDATKRINSLPTPASISERVFHVEKNLRAEHERCQRDIDERMKVAVKDIGDIKVHIKGLNKLWNEAMGGIAKTESVVALRDDLDALKTDIAKVSKRCDSSATEGSDTSLRDLVTKLQTSVSDLSANFDKATSEATVALIRANELQVQIKALQSAEESSKVEALNVDVLDIRNRLDGLYKAVSILSELRLVPQF